VQVTRVDQDRSRVDVSWTRVDDQGQEVVETSGYWELASGVLIRSNILNRGDNDHLRTRRTNASRIWLLNNTYKDGSQKSELQVNHSSLPVHND
jgi:hypothetical protein